MSGQPGGAAAPAGADADAAQGSRAAPSAASAPIVAGALAAGLAVMAAGVIETVWLVVAGGGASGIGLALALTLAAALPAALVGATVGSVGRILPAPSARAVHLVAITALVLAGGEALTVRTLVEHHASPGFIGLAAGTAAPVWGALATLAGVALARLLGRLPLRRPAAAAAAWLVLVWLMLGGAALLSPALAVALPLHLAATATVAIAAIIPATSVARRAARALARSPGRRQALVLAGGFSLAAVLMASGVLSLGDREDARAAVSRSPALDAWAGALRALSDVDGDGSGWLLGGGDCRPLDRTIHPGAHDLPGDGVDQDCSGTDRVRRGRPPARQFTIPPALAGRRFSILLITIDTVRADHVGWDGYRRATTPSLDALAARATVFERAYAAGSSTIFSLPALETSAPTEALPLGAQTHPGGFPRRLGDRAVTLAEVLAQRGMRTGLFTAAPYFDGWNLDQGFDQVVNLKPGGAQPSGARLTAHLLEWLRSIPAEDRWFAWIHYMEPHAPYSPPAGAVRFGQGSAAVDRYDGEIRYDDDRIGEVLAALAADPARAASTIVVVTADHGEHFTGDSGGHGGVREEIIHVPLFIAVPGMAPRRIAAPVSLLDVAPTLAVLAGAQVPAGWLGRPLVPEIARGHGDPGRVVFGADPRTHEVAAVGQRWKLAWDQRDDVTRLIDLASDPGEERDRGRQEPRRRAALRQALIDWHQLLLDTRR